MFPFGVLNNLESMTFAFLTLSVCISDLADGTWKQIVVQMAADGIQIILNQKPLVIEQITPWKPLEEYEQTPFGDQGTSVMIRKIIIISYLISTLSKLCNTMHINYIQYNFRQKRTLLDLLFFLFPTDPK